MSIILFIAIDLFSRIKLFSQNLCLRSSKNSSSVSKLETKLSIFQNQNSKLEPQNSILILKNFKGRESSCESRLSTYLWAVLYVYIQVNECMESIEVLLHEMP